MLLSDVVFWLSLSMFLSAFTLLFAEWLHDETIPHFKNSRLNKLARWLVFISGIVCGGSVFVNGFLAVHSVAARGATIMALGFILIQIILFLFSPMQIPQHRGK